MKISFAAALLLHALLLMLCLRVVVAPRALPVGDDTRVVVANFLTPETPAPAPPAAPLPAAEPLLPPTELLPAPTPVPTTPAPEPIERVEETPIVVAKKTGVEIQRPHSAPPAASRKPARPAAAGTQTGTAGHAPAAPATRARYLSNPSPEYPAEARRQRQEGVVLLNVQVGADGRVHDVTLQRSSGFPALDQAAMQAVRRWTFEPARAAGVPIASRVDVPVRFRLQ